MHGTIAVRSVPGQGSTFRITFPNVAVTEAPETRAATDSAEGDFSEFAPATILVADDVALNRQLLTGYFEGTAHKLIAAVNGLEALEKAARERPDLILMDMRMPELDGYQATQRLKADPALRHIPVIAVTASSFREEEARARKVCDGFIRKPLNRSELLGELRRFLKPAAKPAAAECSAPADVSAVRSELPPEALARWPELMAKLRQEQEQVWPELCQTLEITPVESFGQRLRDWGNEYGAELLRRYGEALFEQAAKLDLDRLPKTLEQFPELIDQLERQTTSSET